MKKIVNIATGEVSEVANNAVLQEGFRLFDPNQDAVDVFQQSMIDKRAKRWYVPTEKTGTISDETLESLKVCNFARLNRTGTNGAYVQPVILVDELTYPVDSLTTNMVANMTVEEINARLNKSTLTIVWWEPTAQNTRKDAQGMWKISFELLEA